ncbi:replication protein [Streptomyces sp. NBC_00513]|uniref:replication protein n=1 Tax=unclassified Streptomyces TaxID=2593676 RepID=UPI0022568027|nr:replication protein [Streptomyces sp. NBC_00424]MCX5079374.1 replication protein [Streptomyces sp. NBC_00424]MCX5079384.1 replication protein [Streptomyces sp. NBC_00424]WUD46456.1 replication protein [Streptomyces sp. NBC_00513]WUD46466.1 replication protein [Streptomyces sp. NBC_00513]
MTEFSKSGQTASDLRERPEGGAGESEGAQRPSEQTRADKAAAAAIRRYQGRKVLNRVSGIDACGGCGRRVLDPETGVIYARSTRGYVVTIGLVRCGRIWFCPECSGAIRRGRTEELKTGALRWLAAGGTLAVVVLTARHNRTHELARLAAAMWGAPMLDADGAPVRDRNGKPRRVPGAYQTMLTDPRFYGRPEAVSWWERKDGSFGHSVRAAEQGIRHRIGYAGMVRASEVTRSLEHGWHPHTNGLVFLGGKVNGTPAKGKVAGYFTPGGDALEEWEDWLRELWTGALAKADPEFTPSTDCYTRDCKCEGKGHGVMVKLITSADDEALIEYLTKVQDGKAPAASVRADLDAASGAAMETTRADNKSYRGQSMTPFQMLYRLHDLEVARLKPARAEGYGTAAQCRIWWAEYESAMAGRRAIEWTRGLRGHVQLTGDDSDETNKAFVFEQDKNQELTGGVILTRDAHDKVVDGDAELHMQDVIKTESYDTAADVVVDLGGRADHVRVATAEQLARVQADLYERVNAKARKRRSEQQVAEWMAKYKPAKSALAAPVEAVNLLAHIRAARHALTVQ